VDAGFGMWDCAVTERELVLLGGLQGPARVRRAILFAGSFVMARLMAWKTRPLERALTAPTSGPRLETLRGSGLEVDTGGSSVARNTGDGGKTLREIIRRAGRDFTRLFSLQGELFVALCSAGAIRSGLSILLDACWTLFSAHVWAVVR